MKMQKIIACFSSIFAVGFIIAFLYGVLSAAGTITVTYPTPEITNKGMQIVRMRWVGSTGPAGTGGVTAVATANDINGWVQFVSVVPGTTSPTNDYDITLTDEDNVDIMGGELANMSSLTGAQYAPKMDGLYGERFVDGTLTLNVSNNTTAGGAGRVIVYVKGKY